MTSKLAPALVYERLYIDGKWTRPASKDVSDILNPATEEILGRIPAASSEDVDAAVRAAVVAQPGWAATPAAERADAVRRIGDALAARGEALLQLLVNEVGTPRSLAQVMQFQSAVDVFHDVADLVIDSQREEQVLNSVVPYEPIGVVGLIVPLTYPLY